MRQLVAMADDDAVRYFVDDGEGEYEQVAQIVNPGLDVRAVLMFGSVVTDTLALNGKHKPKRSKSIEAPQDQLALDEPKPAKQAVRKGQLGRPRADGTPNQSWGYTQSAVYDTLRRIGPCFVDDLVAAFGHDREDRKAQGAMSTALSTGYRAGVITRESIAPYAAGNPTRWARTRYSAVVVEASSDEQSSD